MTLRERLDHMRLLSIQLTSKCSRTIYSASGTLPAAVLVEDDTHIVEHAAYWSGLHSLAEGRYLSAILNSETARLRVEALQPKGQGGARHFDNLVWELRIPEFNAKTKPHTELAASAAIAERVAASVPLKEGAYFTTTRRTIRDALADHGIANTIDQLVARLLDG